MDTNGKMHKILDDLDAIELELLRRNTEYAKQFLAEEGFDVDKEAAYADQYIRKLKFRAQAIDNKQADQQLMEAVFNRVKEVIKENAQKSTEILMALLQSKTPSVHYRKLDKWTDDEIREVLADLDLVKLMEDLSRQRNV